MRKTRAAKWSKRYTWGSHPPEFVHLPSISPPYPPASKQGGMEGRWRDTASSILRKASVKEVIYQTGALPKCSIVPFHREQRRTQV